MKEIHINVELQSSGGLGKNMIDCDGFFHYLRNYREDEEIGEMFLIGEIESSHINTFLPMITIATFITLIKFIV